MRMITKEQADEWVCSGRYRYLTDDEQSLLMNLGLDVDGDIVSIFPMTKCVNVNVADIYSFVEPMLGKFVFLNVSGANGIISKR